MKKEKWTNDLHDLLADYEMDAPEGLWEEIESALPKHQARTATLRRWAAAAAVGMLLIGGGALMWHAENKPSTMPMAQKTSTTTNTDGAGQRQEPPSPDRKAGASSPLPTLTSFAASPVTTVAAPASTTKAEASEQHEETLLPTEPLQATDKGDDNNQGTMSKDHEPAMPPAKNHHPTPPPMPTSSHASGRFSAGLLASNLSANNRRGSISEQPVSLASPALILDFSNSAAQGKYTNNYTLSNSNQMVLNGFEETAEHHHPLQVGLSLRYAIDGRWSVESGVVYSHVASDFTRKLPHAQMDDHQVLQYVGVPLNIMYRLWSHGSLSVYGSAGGEADVNIKATLETEGLKRDIGKDRVQWSANAAIGAQYQLMPHVSIYLQPGLQYYIDNGSHLKNIFKDQPLGINVQFGLRMNWGE